MELFISKRNGEKIVFGRGINFGIEVVSNAYPGGGYMNDCFEMREEAERLLGFSVAENWEKLLESRKKI